MASQQPRPSWFRFPFMFRAAGPAPVPEPAATITQSPAPRAPPPPQPQPAMVRPAPPPVASPPAAPITRPPAPRTSPSPRPQPTLVRSAPPPVPSPPPAVAYAPPSPLPSVPWPQTATPTPRSPAAPTTAPPRSTIEPTSAPPRSPVPPPPAPVASPLPTVAPIPPASPALRLPAATPAALPPSISRSPVASPTAPPPPRSPAVSPTKHPIVKTSVSMPPSSAPEESQKTSTNVPFWSSIPVAPKTKEQVPSPSKPTPVVQKSILHFPTPTARNASATGSRPEVVKLLERTPVQSTPIKPVSRHPSPSTLSPPQTKTVTDHEPKITAISNGKREPTKDKGLHKKLSESEEYRMRVITLAGQNKGATMELSASNPQSLDKNGKIKTWRNGEKSSSVEGKSVGDKSYDEMVMESPQMTAFMNSNVQGINNSIFYNGTSTHKDPGIHLSLSRKKDQRRQ